MKYEISKNIIFLALFAALLSSAHATTYSDNYRVTDLDQPIEANYNRFMEGDFEEIRRYNFLVFKNSELTEESRKYLSEITQEIQELQESDKEFEITLVGHTEKLTDDENEKRVRSQSYASKIQDWFKKSYDDNASMEISQEYVTAVYDLLGDLNISQERVHFEYRGDLDSLYTSVTKEGRELSNGVFVTLYVNKEEEIDSDRDGVFDKDDKCPGTPRGVKVDAYGCPLDSDDDGIVDYKDECPNTPLGVEVDKKGCPIDSDGDGTPDYKDECSNTPIGISVSPDGCPVKSTLKLNFATNSDKIMQDSYGEIKRFAEFLQENPLYNAVITGHTDSIGKATLNMELSQRRANMTKKALEEVGVSPSRLVAKGRGELDPIESNVTPEGRKANRRIEVELLLNND